MREIKSTQVNIACILMASGQGKRFGGNKLLTPIGSLPMWQYALNATNTPLLSRRQMVTIHEEIKNACGEFQIPCYLHNFPNRNQAIRLGVEALLPYEPDGILFCPCDQPALLPASVEALCKAFQSHTNSICRLQSNGNPGSPVLFPKRCFSDLCNLPEKMGGSFVIKKDPLPIQYVSVEDPYELFDIDTKEDLEVICQRLCHDTTD